MLDKNIYMKAPFTFFLLFTITLVSAQGIVQDSIPVQETKRSERTKTITVGPFTGIKLFSGIQVKLIPSMENKLVLSGENFETVVTTLKNDVLRIKHSLGQIFNPKNTYIEVYFSTPLDLIHAYQGSIVESQAVLKATKIELKAREWSAIDLHIKSEKISSSVYSGSTLSLRGVAVNHELKILGGGICESETLLTEQTTVKVTAGGVAYIHASDLLEATVNVGGTVRIHGRPIKLIKRKRIGGTITEMN